MFVAIHGPNVLGFQNMSPCSLAVGTPHLLPPAVVQAGAGNNLEGA